MALAAVGFVLMTRWGLTSLSEWSANIALVVCGFGFGLALAPVNAALLAFTDDDVHGVASAFVVVARMVGMLVGISALTVIGLRRYYAEQADVPPVREVCDGSSRCDEFTRLLKLAGIAQEHAVFWGAAGLRGRRGRAGPRPLRRRAHRPGQCARRAVGALTRPGGQLVWCTSCSP